MFSKAVWDIINNSIYVIQGITALWGAYCIVVVFMRLGQKRIRTEQQQDELLAAVDEPLLQGDFEGAQGVVEGDQRALPQLIHLACNYRNMNVGKVEELLVDRFSRDVMSDLEFRVNWINNVIKTAPMLGLLGTVLGMMAAFDKLATQQDVKPDALASDIAFALITTAIGLAVAIPCTVCLGAFSVRIRKLEDLVASGLSHFMESFAIGQSQRKWSKGSQVPTPPPIEPAARS
jgi:biopolymer transport protein ExbB/TolQ